MYDDCALASKSIEFEQYILMDDGAGRRFLELFAAKAKEGVKVRLMFDGIGSRGLLVSPYLGEIRKAGGEVHFYNSLLSSRLFRPSRWLPRSHIKTMLIDGTIAHTGSSCLWEIMSDWHDVHCRFSGPAAADVARHFSQIWESREKNEKIAGLTPRPDAAISYTVSAPALKVNEIYRELISRIKNAKTSVKLVTPYFLPPHRLRRALEKAARRGVSVQVMISAKSDVPIADHVSHSYFRRLLRKGIEIYLFPHQVLHAKFAVVDGEWATVGSTNMDYLSLLRNREANLIIRDASTADTLEQAFVGYRGLSRRADKKYCDAIPLQHRIAGYLGRCLKEVL